jgi:CheY-like chemotaxis protein
VPTHILIVEGDAALSARMRGALEERGFSVQETPDGRTCLEVARQAAPACVVLAVDLPAGQNGYILCGKLKKDDDLRSVPVAIVGSPEGFAQHGKLKNRADAYLAKPLQLGAFADTILQLTGHQATPAVAAPAARSKAPAGFDLEDATVSGDPDLDLIDAAFDTGPLIAPPPPPTPLHETEPPPAEDSAFASLDSLGGDGRLETGEQHGDQTGDELGALTAEGAAPEPEADVRSEGGPADDDPQAVQREVLRLRSALEDAQARSFSSDVRIHQLEAELAGRAATEEDGSTDRSQRDRDQILRRDRDILRLKADLHAREQELSDLRDQAMQVEQQALETTGELSRRDAQIKALQARTEQERRRADQAAERSEAAQRSTEEQVLELQAAVDAASARADAAEQEANDLRVRAEMAEQARDLSETELAAARRDRELNRAHADGTQRQMNALQAAYEQSQADLAAMREQLAARDAARDDELGALQHRLREAEAVARKHEERVTRLYARLKAEERAREKAARAVAMAGQLLSQSNPGTPATDKSPGGDDEPAAA